MSRMYLQAILLSEFVQQKFYHLSACQMIGMFDNYTDAWEKQM